MFDDIIQDQIKNLRSYQPGMTMKQLARQYGIEEKNIIKLASNENPLGPSPSVIKAVHEAAKDAHRYPDQFELTDALAKKYQVAPEQIILGNGSNDILDLVSRIFLGPKTEAVSSEYGFQVYQLLTKLTGAHNVITPAKDYGHDLDAMRNATTDSTRVVWIANPNNPTGTYENSKSVSQFLESIPKHIIVVLDEAYYEYIATIDPHDSVALIKRFPNLIVVRTFSKAYGLAGLRIGYGVAASGLIELLQRARQPFNVSNVGMAAAHAALADQQHLDESIKVNEDGKQYLVTQFEKLKIRYIPSFANFITIIHPQATKLHSELLAHGIITRPLLSDNLPDCLRCSIGLASENERLVTTLKQILAL